MQENEYGGIMFRMYAGRCHYAHVLVKSSIISTIVINRITEWVSSEWVVWLMATMPVAPITMFTIVETDNPDGRDEEASVEVSHRWVAIAHITWPSSFNAYVMQSNE